MHTEPILEYGTTESCTAPKRQVRGNLELNRAFLRQRRACDVAFRAMLPSVSLNRRRGVVAGKSLVRDRDAGTLGAGGLVAELVIRALSPARRIPSFPPPGAPRRSRQP